MVTLSCAETESLESTGHKRITQCVYLECQHTAYMACCTS